MQSSAVRVWAGMAGRDSGGAPQDKRLAVIGRGNLAETGERQHRQCDALFYRLALAEMAGEITDRDRRTGGCEDTHEHGGLAKLVARREFGLHLLQIIVEIESRLRSFAFVVLGGFESCLFGVRAKARDNARSEIETANSRMSFTMEPPLKMGELP